MAKLKPWIVRHREGWCISLDHPEHEQPATACGMVVILPGGVKQGRPTCRACLRALSHSAGSEAVATPPPDVVTVPREEWEHILALARIMANHPRIHNDLFLGMECEAEPHLIALHKLGRLDALRSGEAGKGAG